MKSLLQTLFTIFVLIGMCSLMPVVSYGADLTFEEILDQATHGNADAQYMLGDMYRFGEGVAQDIAEGVKWYRKAAEQGHLRALYLLGWMYQHGGSRVVKDDREAVKWYRKAAAQGHSEAQYMLGWMYQNGKGVVQDLKEAAKWFNKAAEQGHTQAQFNLGWMYDQGEGVLQDYVTAYAWYNLAALQKHDGAKYNRDFIVAKMVPDQIAKGQKLSSALYDKIY